MSQTPPQFCTQCRTPISPGTRFCPNCGATLSEQAVPTVMATPYPQSPSNPNLPSNADMQPQPYGQYSSAPPPPAFSPTPHPAGDPYSSPNIPNYVPPQQYAPPQRKKAAPWTYIIIGAVVLLLLSCGVGSFLLIKLGTPPSGGNGGTANGGDTGGNFGTTQSLNLSLIYASDQITVTSIQQAPKFSDDDLTTFNEHPNYVRINLKEQQTAKKDSFFSYTDAFRLVLPDKTTIAPVKAQQYSAPAPSEMRTNWLDFGVNSKVDLSKLTLRAGASDEAQMDVPLKNGADLTQYQPKTVTPNTQFDYAKMNWTLKSVTRSLYYEGKQAKTGQVYVTVDLKVDNNSQYDVFLLNFANLKAGTSSVGPDLHSNDQPFEEIKAGTTNVEGSLTFLTTTAPKYTLDCKASTDNTSWGEQTVDFTIA